MLYYAFCARICLLATTTIAGELLNSLIFHGDIKINVLQLMDR